jgi:hypothetical protein
MKTLLIIFALTSVQALAAEDYTGYEDIVRSLQSSESRTQMSDAPSGIDSVRIHTGIGMVSSRVSLDMPKGFSKSKNLEGVEAIIGIDLFSPRWLAESAVRTFNSTNYSSTEIRMREFDLRMVHEIPMSSLLIVRFGGGISARYLNFSGPLHSPSQAIKNDYTTPASLLLFGARFNFHPRISLGLETSFRSALISETIDDSALDGAVRITGTF